MTILITGATGFLGSSLVTKLTQQELTVRVLARDEHKAKERFGETVTIVQGDITNKGQVKRAVDGSTVIYHLAGRLYHPSTPAQIYRQIHCEGTRVLLDACQGQPQLQRLVYCSTTGVYGVTGQEPANEKTPFAPTNPYEATKLQGELLALQAHQEHGLPVSIVRPGLVYGPGDKHLLGLFAAIQKGLFRTIDGGTALLHPVYIDDLINAFLLCAGQPKAIGQSYNIAGACPVTVSELASTIAHSMKRKLSTYSIPLWLANFVSDMFSITPGFQGERAPLTRSRIRFLTHSRIYSIDRAKNELGYTPNVGLEEGIKRTSAWYQKHGYL